MSFELDGEFSIDDDFFKKDKFTHHDGDKGEGCAHDESFGRLTIGNVLRRDKGTVCVNGASEKLKDVRPSRFVPYEPRRPEPHPINVARLDEWKNNTLRNKSSFDSNDDGAQFDDEEDRFEIEKIFESLRDHKVDMKEDIERFARVVRHVGYEEFLKALATCFAKFYELFPKNTYTHKLMNEVSTPTSPRQKQFRSEKWMAEIVNHEGLYDLTEEGKAEYWCEDEKGRLRNHTVKHETAEKEIIRFAVDDAAFSGENFYRLKPKPEVYIVPYVQSLRRLAETVRNPIADAFFVNATTGGVTRRTRKEPETLKPADAAKVFKHWKDAETMQKLFPSVFKHVIVIYAEEMVDSHSIPIPFYFDHKVADKASLGRDYWKLRGYHKESFGPDPDINRTPFIGGCEENKDFEADEEYRRIGRADTCPYPPYR